MSVRSLYNKTAFYYINRVDNERGHGLVLITVIEKLLT